MGLAFFTPVIGPSMSIRSCIVRSGIFSVPSWATTCRLLLKRLLLFLLVNDNIAALRAAAVFSDTTAYITRVVTVTHGLSYDYCS